MNCVIIDDESAAISILENYVAKVPKQLTLSGSFLSSVEALEYVQNNNVDLVFLDINMPNVSGLKVLELLKGKCQAILTTAYTEYALEGYKYEVIDYLTKPIPFDAFLSAVNKAENRIKASTEIKDSIQDFIVVKTDHKGKFVKIAFEDILFIESQRNYVAIYTKNKEQTLTLLTLKDVEENLPTKLFCRVHKTFIIALSQIKLIDGGEIILKDAKDKIPIGATYREAFFKILEDNMLTK